MEFEINIVFSFMYMVVGGSSTEFCVFSNPYL